jgi:hypothetical protein
MTTYRSREEIAREADRERINAVHNTYPHLGAQRPFNPSGLVPYPCQHGVPVKPSRYPVTKGGNAWFDDDGNEQPPFGGLSWGRAKYLDIAAFGGRDGIPYAVAECVVCTTGTYPDDFYIAADGSSLR